jgi:hypothetical protein
MLDHSHGKEPCREFPVAVTPRRLSIPCAHWAGRTPSILFLPTFLQQVWLVGWAGRDIHQASCHRVAPCGMVGLLGWVDAVLGTSWNASLE